MVAVTTWPAEIDPVCKTGPPKISTLYVVAKSEVIYSVMVGGPPAFIIPT